MDMQTNQPAPPSKPEWALSRGERKRQALAAAGIKRSRFPWAVAIGIVVIGGIAAVAIPQFTNSQASAPAEVPAAAAAPVTKQILPIDLTTVETTTL